MNRKRTTNRTRRLFMIVELITPLLLAAALLAHPFASLAAPGMLHDADGAWNRHAPPGPSARRGHSMASLGGDQVLLFGGDDGAFNSQTWVYDLSDNTWTNQALATSRSAAEWIAAGPSARAFHAMAPLGGDQVLLFGGYDGIDPNGESWVYDLSDNTWTNRTPAAGPSARFGHAMASLGGDRGLLFGGYDGSGYSNETWLATGFYSWIWHRVYLPLVAK